MCVLLHIVSCVQGAYGKLSAKLQADPPKYDQVSAGGTSKVRNGIHIRCYIYDIFGRETTIYMVIYGVFIRFWPIVTISYKCTHGLVLWQKFFGIHNEDIEGLEGVYDGGANLGKRCVGRAYIGSACSESMQSMHNASRKIAKNLIFFWCVSNGMIGNACVEGMQSMHNASRCKQSLSGVGVHLNARSAGGESVRTARYE